MKFEFLKENFKNQNYWITHANSTANILFAFNGVFIFLVAKEIVDKICRPTYFQMFLIAAFFIAAVLSIFALILVIFPRLGEKTSSLLYFGGICNQKENEFKDRIKNINDNQILEMLSNQIYQNAKIANQKFIHVREAVILTSLNFLVAIVLIFF